MYNVIDQSLTNVKFAIDLLKAVNN